MSTPITYSPLHSFTLSNGLRVYLREDHRAPLVSAQLWYHVGSSHEPDGHTGLSHALEHLMFEGSSKLADGQYSRLMTRLGGDPNAFTSEDATVYYVTLPASRLEVALEAMADAMATAKLSKVPFAREMAVVMAERRSAVDNAPLALALEQHQLLAHGKNRYATPIIGFRDDLQSLTQATARQWYQTWYHPNNATLTIAGAAHLPRLREQVERHFAGIAAQRLPPAPRPRQDPQLTRRAHTLHIEGLREGVVLSFNCPSLATANTATQAHALSLIPQLLTEGIASRLQRQMVQERQLLLAMRSSYEPLRRGDSLLTLYAFSNPGTTTPAFAAEQLLQEIEAFRQAPPRANELQRAKAQLLAKRLFARDDIHEQAAVVGRMAASGLDPTTLDAETHAIEAVTGEQVRQAALECLNETRLTTTLMHGKENIDE